MEDAAFMADLLGEVDINIPSRSPAFPIKAVKSESRRKVRVLSPPIQERLKTSMSSKTGRITDPSLLLNTPPLEASYQDQDDFFPSINDEDFEMNDPIPSSPIEKAMGRKSQGSLKFEDEEEEIMEVSQAIGDQKVKAAGVNISGSRPVPKVVRKPAYPSPQSSSPTRPPLEAVDASTWNDVNSRLNVLSSPASQTLGFGKLRVEDAVEEDGSLRMFWTDYTEVNGSLCFFGKVKDKATGSWASAFVKIDNILRKLFFLPREFRHSMYDHMYDLPDADMIRRIWSSNYGRSRHERCLPRSG